MSTDTLVLIGMVLGPVIITGLGGYLIPKLVSKDRVWTSRVRAYLIVAPMLIALSTTIFVLHRLGTI